MLKMTCWENVTVTGKLNECIVRSKMSVQQSQQRTVDYMSWHAKQQKLDHPVIKLRSTPWAVCTEQKKTYCSCGNCIKAMTCFPLWHIWLNFVYCDVKVISQKLRLHDDVNGKQAIKTITSECFQSINTAHKLCKKWNKFISANLPRSKLLKNGFGSLDFQMPKRAFLSSPDADSCSPLSQLCVSVYGGGGGCTLQQWLYILSRNSALPIPQIPKPAAEEEQLTCRCRHAGCLKMPLLWTLTWRS